MKKVAEKLKATPAQVAIAWLLAKSPVMVPIPKQRLDRASRGKRGRGEAQAVEGRPRHARMTEAWLPWLLMLQGVLGGDTLVNHEIIARLLQKPSARPEPLCSVRGDLDRAALRLAWFAWHGAPGYRRPARGRGARHRVRRVGREPQPRAAAERAHPAHLPATLNLGAIIAVLYPLLREWGSRPTLSSRALVCQGSAPLPPTRHRARLGGSRPWLAQPPACYCRT